MKKMIISLMAGALMASMVSAKVITVRALGGAQYVKLQTAIDSATAGDTLLVGGGEYKGKINLTKKLTIIGNGYASNEQSASIIDTLSVTGNSGSEVNGFSIGYLMTGSATALNVTNLKLGQDLIGTITTSLAVDSLTATQTVVNSISDKFYVLSLNSVITVNAGSPGLVIGSSFYNSMIVMSTHCYLATPTISNSHIMQRHDIGSGYSLFMVNSSYTISNSFCNDGIGDSYTGLSKYASVGSPNFSRGVIKSPFFTDMGSYYPEPKPNAGLFSGGYAWTVDTTVVNKYAQYPIMPRITSLTQKGYGAPDEPLTVKFTTKAGK